MGTAEEMLSRRVELASESPYDRLRAAYALAEQGSFEGQQVFLDALKHQDAEVRLQAVSRLGRIGPGWAVAPVAELLNDDEPQNQREASLALVNISRASVVPWFIKALESDDDEVLVDAQSALRLLLGPEVPLSTDIADEDEEEAERVSKWWEVAQDKFWADLCYYEGRLVSLGDWIASLRDGDQTHFEWVLPRLHWYTGVDFGSAPQSTVAAQWESWWKENENLYETGRRYFHGHLVNGE